MLCASNLYNLKMLSDNFSLRYYFLHLMLYFLAHHLLGSVQGSKINIRGKIDFQIFGKYLTLDEECPLLVYQEPPWNSVS